MKLWIDDTRNAPLGYIGCKSVNEAMKLIVEEEEYHRLAYPPDSTILLDMGYDVGTFARNGSDYIELLDWLEETGRNYPIHIHSMNPVGVQNMRAIIIKEWLEVSLT